MRRREFIKVIVGTAAAWPLTARAQQSEKARLIGVLLPVAENDSDFQHWVAKFRHALQELGWVDGRNVQIDIRWARDTADIRRHAAELAALLPDVILAHGA